MKGRSYKTRPLIFEKIICYDLLLQVPLCEDESVQLFRVAFFRIDFFQNPYFSGQPTFLKFDILGKCCSLEKKIGKKRAKKSRRDIPGQT